MDLQEFQRLLDAAKMGRVLLSKCGKSRLEAFFGNALYFRRGMSTMDKYKTVKEVCALTGLTRKHLYYFHHENVVRAVAYANYSVKDHDGYKLYDDAAVEKLQQIALYYQLGLKRDEIKDIMLAPNYDSNMVLHTLLTMEREKKFMSSGTLRPWSILFSPEQKMVSADLYVAYRWMSWDELFWPFVTHPQRIVPLIGCRMPTQKFLQENFRLSSLSSP